MHKRQELDPRLFELYFSESVVDEWVVSDFFEERVFFRKWRIFVDQNDASL